MQDETESTHIKPTELYIKQTAMIEHILKDRATNTAGKRFAQGCLDFLSIQGYLSEKQCAVLDIIYKTSVETYP